MGTKKWEHAKREHFREHQKQHINVIKYSNMALNFLIRNNHLTARLRLKQHGEEIDLKQSTGFKVMANHFDKKHQTIKDKVFLAEYAQVEEYLHETKQRYKQLIRKQKPYTMVEAKQFLNLVLCLDNGEPRKEKPVNLLDFILEFQQEQKKYRHPKSGKPLSNSTLSRYKVLHDHLTAFSKAQKRTIDFQDINLDFYYDFLEFIAQRESYAPNTQGKYIQTLKAVMNGAVEKGLTDNLKYKNKKFARLDVEVDSIYLNKEEVKALYDLDLSHDKRLERIRDFFIFGCVTGLRSSDINLLTKNDIKGEYLHLKQSKTVGGVTIPLNKLAFEILEKYDYNLEKNAKMNKHLPAVGKMAGIDEIMTLKLYVKGKLTEVTKPKAEFIKSHTARRSFATNCYHAGIPALTIMNVLGQKSEKTFYKYVKLDKKEHADILKHALDY